MSHIPEKMCDYHDMELFDCGNHGVERYVCPICYERGIKVVEAAKILTEQSNIIVKAWQDNLKNAIKEFYEY